MGKVNGFGYGADIHYSNGVSTSYIKFSVGSNLHYRFNSAEDLLNNSDTLAAMIRHHHEYQVERFSILDDYYKTRGTNIMDNCKCREKEKADHQSARNFGRVPCAFDIGYSTGNPVEVQVEGTDQQEEIEEFNINNDIDGLNAEFWLDMDKYGRSHKVIYRDSDDTDYADLANIFETFVVYDTIVRREPILAIRYSKTRFGRGADKQRIQLIVYTKEENIIYDEMTLTVIRLKDPQDEPHEYKEVPIIKYSPNCFRMGLYKGVLSLIDLYDAGRSDMTNYVTDLNDALLVISGGIEASGLSTEDVTKQREVSMLLFEPGTDMSDNKTNVTIRYTHKQYDMDSVEAYRDRARKDTHEISVIPDLTDDNFSGVRSGETMRYKSSGLEQTAATK